MPTPPAPPSNDINASPAYFNDALADAERLLKYAAEIGIDVDPSTRDAVLTARAEEPKGWSQETASKLLAALTWLAARLKPVTAESLQAYRTDTSGTVRNYYVVSIVLACLIIPMSAMTFMASALSNDLSSDIDAANKLAATLRTQLGSGEGAVVAAVAGGEESDEADAAGSPSPAPTAAPRGKKGVKKGPVYPAGINEAEIVTEMQDYASEIRLIYDRSRKLNALVFWSQQDPFKFSDFRNSPTSSPEKARRDTFELTPGIPNFYADRDRLTGTYQQVRNFAQNLVTDQAVVYGAINACLLPVLYAVLGTCAYLLRSFEDQMSTRTFTPSIANSARFVIAAICGAVVGLFNNFAVSSQASLSPLALAFVVGYAVDVFFTFLEGLLKAFTKNTASMPPPPSAVN